MSDYKVSENPTVDDTPLKTNSYVLDEAARSLGQ